MVGSDSHFRDAWLTGAARAFFVSAYADYVEEGHSTDNDLTDDERETRLALPRPGGGEAWEHYAPESPPNAYALAGELWAKLERSNERSVYVLARDAARADHPCERCNATGHAAGDPLNDECAACDGHGYTEDIDPDEFGSDLAMQAMGHGVSWFDDHERFDLKVPHVECSEFSFSDDVYQEGK